MVDIKFLNEDCFKTMQDMVDNGKKVDIILTSPPYNTGRTTQNQRVSTTMRTATTFTSIT